MVRDEAQGVAVPAINISKLSFADGYRFLQHVGKADMPPLQTGAKLIPF